MSLAQQTQRVKAKTQPALKNRYTNAHIQIHVCTHANSTTRTHTQTHTYSHTIETHTRMHAHAHTHTHTHTLLQHHKGDVSRQAQLGHKNHVYFQSQGDTKTRTIAA